MSRRDGKYGFFISGFRRSLFRWTAKNTKPCQQISKWEKLNNIFLKVCQEVLGKFGQ
jgi:hypothetical protein